MRNGKKVQQKGDFILIKGRPSVGRLQRQQVHLGGYFYEKKIQRVVGELTGHITRFNEESSLRERDVARAKGLGGGVGKDMLAGLEAERAWQVAEEGGELGELPLMGHQERWGPPSPGKKRYRVGNPLGLEARPGKQRGGGEDKKGRQLQHIDSSGMLLLEYLLRALVRDCRRFEKPAECTCDNLR